MSASWSRSLMPSSSEPAEIATFLLGVLLWPILATGGDVAITF